MIEENNTEKLEEVKPNNLMYFVAPILIGLFPILFFFSRNIQELAISSLFQVILVFLFFNFIGMIALRLVYKNREKASLLLAFFWLLFFSYGHVYNILENAAPFLTTGYNFLSILWILLMGIVIVGIKRLKKSLPALLRSTYITGLVLVLMQIVNISMFVILKNDDTTASAPASDIYLANKEEDLSPGNNQNLPDIYFVIPDAYPRSDTLEEYFDFSNDEFDGYLQDQGFYIADRSHANYYHTALSIPAALNMSYLAKDDELGGVPESALIELYKNSRVLQFLKNGGYKFVNNSNLYLTLFNDSADLNMSCGKNNEFLAEFIRTTILKPLGWLSDIERNNKREDAQCVMANIAGENTLNSPKFVFTHLLPPHPPYLFGEDGEDIQEVNISLTSGTRWLAKEPFLAQLKYVNKQISEAVSQILSRSSDAIIIIQSDHGTLSSATEATTIKDKRPIVLTERSRNYIAIHVPEYCDKSEFYETMTSVNLFRVVFNSCFESGFELLEDEVFYSPAPDIVNGAKVHKTFENISEIIGE